MRGVQQVCILCRYTGRPALTTNVSPSSRRAATNQARGTPFYTKEPYDASKLVLDLEAADSKYVRRYEDTQKEKEIQQEEERHQKTLKWKAKQLVKETAPIPIDSDAKGRSKKSKRRDPKKVPDIFRPNPVDYMSYALIQSDMWRKDEYATLRGVLSECLLLGIGNYMDHIQWLRAYEVLPYKVEQALSSENPDEGVKSAILQCANIQELGRLTAIMTRTVAGCNFLSFNGKHLIYVIDKLFENANGKGTGLKLKYINSLVQKLEMMGVVPGDYVSAAGLLYASQVSNCGAMYNYLEIILAKKDNAEIQPDETVLTIHRQALVSAVSRFDVSWPPLAKASIGEDPMMWRREYLRILSSSEPGIPMTREERKPCFALLVHDIDMYVDYINALAKIRADYEILYEVSHPELTPIPGISKEEARRLKGVQIFVNAFAGVGNPLQALKILNEHTQRIREQRTGEGESLKSMTRTPKSLVVGSGLGGKEWATLRKALVRKYMGRHNKTTLLHRDLQDLNEFSASNMNGLEDILWSPFTSNEPTEWTEAIDDLMVSRIRALEGNSQSTRSF